MNKLLISIAIKVLLLTLVVTGVVFFSLNNARANELKPFDGDTPALALTSLEGEQIKLDDFKGKVTMVQFWATYCTPCRVEMPSMNRLQTKLGDSFKILAVNMGETPEEVQQFVDEVKPEFTILMDEEGGSIADWKVFAAPATFILDPAGKIRYTLFGATEWDSEEMVAELKALL